MNCSYLSSWLAFILLLCKILVKHSLHIRPLVQIYLYLATRWLINIEKKASIENKSFNQTRFIKKKRSIVSIQLQIHQIFWFCFLFNNSIKRNPDTLLGTITWRKGIRYVNFTGARTKVGRPTSPCTGLYGAWHAVGF